MRQPLSSHSHNDSSGSSPRQPFKITSRPNTSRSPSSRHNSLSARRRLRNSRNRSRLCKGGSTTRRKPPASRRRRMHRFTNPSDNGNNPQANGVDNRDIGATGPRYCARLQSISSRPVPVPVAMALWSPGRPTTPIKSLSCRPSRARSTISSSSRVRAKDADDGAKRRCQANIRPVMARA